MRSNINASVDHRHNHSGDLLIDTEEACRDGACNEANPVMKLLPCEADLAVRVVSNLGLDKVSEPLLC